MQVNEIWSVQNIKYMYKNKIKSKYIMKYYSVQNKMKLILKFINISVFPVQCTELFKNIMFYVIINNYNI